MENATITIKNLSERINSFDNWYYMSDDSRVYDKCTEEKRLINEVLSSLSFDQLIELKSLITCEMSLDTFSSHFKNVASPSNEETPESITTASFKEEDYCNETYKVIPSGIEYEFNNGDTGFYKIAKDDLAELLGHVIEIDVNQTHEDGLYLTVIDQMPIDEFEFVESDLIAFASDPATANTTTKVVNKSHAFSPLSSGLKEIMAIAM